MTVVLDPMKRFVERFDWEAIQRHYATTQISSGPVIAQFTRDFAAYHCVDPERVVTVASCTDAMEIALRALTRRFVDDDVEFDVAVPAVTWVGTWNAVEAAHCRPYFVDVNDFGLLDAELLVPGKVDAVLAVDLYGNTFGSLAYFKDCATTGEVIVDCAQATERYHSEAFACCYSFQAAKSLPLGGGGAIIFQSVEDAKFARKYAYHGLGEGSSRRLQEEAGRKSIMLPVHAAMGRQILPDINEFLADRLDFVKGAMERAEKAGIRTIDRTPRDCAHAFVVSVEIGSEDDFAKAMRRDSITVRRQYPRFDEHPHWADRPSVMHNKTVKGVLCSLNMDDLRERGVRRLEPFVKWYKGMGLV